ncbi:hypothetical protein K466DRAFT_659445 [Polyporus arcularius HHB13444]|uniref:RING-type domain-containing protein n=1 Tax=Polyporus arcularius HHB13444 TaxID=1314778 RepID=A0A5C3Q1G3_9APHY|nr:hypothetical protein K466DRAFT_659445 [Polyporus arcularius HHB13444]
MAKKNKHNPGFARCNQCKLVFKDGNECGAHAESTGHNRNPSYYCTVCSVAFTKRKMRAEHIKTAGHVQTEPKIYATVVQAAKAVAVPARTSISIAAASKVACHPAQPAASTSTGVPQPTVSDNSESDTSDDEVPNSSSLRPPAGPGSTASTSAASQNHSKNPAAPSDHGKVVYLGLANFQESSTFQRNDEQSKADRDCIFLRAAGLVPEVNGPTQDQEIRCATCQFACPSEDTLQLHYNKSLSHPSCEGCRLGFDSPASLAIHQKQCFAFKASAVGGADEARSTDGHATPGPSVTSTATSSSTSIRAHSDKLQSATTVTELENTRCAKCDIGFSSVEGLQVHYDESPLHPTCRTCGLGFASISSWATHKARCPPPGSTAATDGALNIDVRGAAGLGGKGKEVVRDVVSPAKNSVASAELSPRTHVQGEDPTPATAGASSSTSLSAGPSEVFSVSPTTPEMPETLGPQRASSPTPSTAVSTISIASYARSSSNTTPPRSSLMEDTERMCRVLRAEQPELAAPPREAHEELSRPQSRSVYDNDAGSRAAAGVPIRRPPGAYPTPMSGHTRSGTPMDTAQSPTPTHRDPNAIISFHCRSCLRNPCVQPVAAFCGHIFCHSCILQELSTKMCCPVCQRTFFVRLHVEITG